MADKNENTIPQSPQTNHFEVHTMEKDNAGSPKKVHKGSQKKKQKEQKKPKAPKMSTSPFAKDNEEKNMTPPTENPFFAQKVEKNKKEAEPKKGSFAPQTKEEITEKINYTPADIAPQEPVLQSPKKSMNIVRVMMIILIVIFILGAIGVAVYVFVFDKAQAPQEIVNVDVALPPSQEEIVEEPEPAKQIYSTDLPNYFSFDVESETSENDILTELETIKKNMRDNDIDGPISFVVTDTNNNPVSFHVFALSIGMQMPQDVLPNLEENFELYAYNDPASDVRFGFAIDAKNVNLLQEALSAHETELPGAFKVILDGAPTGPVGIVFRDSTYNTSPIRYTNLDDTESYSIDYTVNNLRLLIGTSKNTLRAIIEDTRGGTYVPQDESSDAVMGGEGIVPNSEEEMVEDIMEGGI
jgi:hypothetical protein